MAVSFNHLRAILPVHDPSWRLPAAGGPGWLLQLTLVGLTAAGVFCFGGPSALRVWLPFGGLYALVLAALFRGRSNGTAIEGWTHLGFIVLGAVWAALWLRGGQHLFIGYNGESHSIWLTSAKAHDFFSLILQDHAASVDPAASPYYYIHHPNLVNRLYSIAAQTIGISLDSQMLGMALLTCAGAAVGFFALRRRFGDGPAAIGIAVLVLNYPVFMSNAPDILRGLHYTLFWVLLYVLEAMLLTRPRLGERYLAVLFFFLILTDWAFFIYCSVFSVIWLMAFDPVPPWRHILVWMVAPAVVALGLYESVVIAAIGWDFFVYDISVTFFKKLNPGTDAESWRSILDIYHAHNIVIWPGAIEPVTLPRLVALFMAATRDAIGEMAWPVLLTFGGTLCGLLVKPRGLWILKIGTVGLAIFCYYGQLPLYGFLPVLAGVAVLARHLVVETHGADRDGSAGWRPVLGACLVFMSATLFAFFSIGIVFSHYFVFLTTTLRAPLLLSEVGMAMAVARGMGRLFTMNLQMPLNLYWARIRLSDHIVFRLNLLLTCGSHWLRPFQAAMSTATANQKNSFPLWFGGILAALAVLLLFLHDVQGFQRKPPLGPPYGAVLSQPQFQGKSFVTSSFEAITWYYTHGWAYMVTANPPDATTEALRYQHFADWRNRAKYEFADYYLCDVSPLFGWNSPRLSETYCDGSEVCDCRAVAAAMSDAGHKPVVVEPAYAVIELNKNISLWRNPAH